MRYTRLALALTLAGLALRLYHLGAPSYWFDEALEIRRAMTPWPQVVWLVEGPDPPLYRLLIAPLSRLSTVEAMLRLPSALFGAAAVFLMYLWCAELGSRRVGVVAAALLAISPVAVYYSQEVSQYSAVICLSLALLIAFERVARRNRASDWLLATVVTLVSLYTYYGLAWLILVLEGWLLLQTWQRRDRGQWQRLALHYAALLALLVILAVAFAVPQYEYQSRLRAAEADTPQLGDTWQAVWANFAQGVWEGVIRFQTTLFGDAPQIISVILAALILLGGIAAWRARARYRAVVGVGLTLLLVLYISDLAGLFYFGTRYSLPLLPLLILCLALALIVLWRTHRLLGLTAGVFVVGVGVAFSPNLSLLPNPWLDLPREDLRPVIAYVNAHAQPDDEIYVYYGAAPAYRLYEPLPRHSTAYGSWFRDWPLSAKIDEIQRDTAGHSRVWLVMSHIHEAEDVQLLTGLQAARTSYVVQDEFSQRDALAVLLERSLLDERGPAIE
ncbi:MAG: glycosyltransferase family 39 protein [Anaerolineae bacterium]